MHELDKQNHKKTIQTSSTTTGFFQSGYSAQKNHKEQGISEWTMKSHEQRNIFPHSALSSLNGVESRPHQPQKKVFFAQFPHISNAVNQRSDSSMAVINKLTDQISYIEKLMLSNNYEIQNTGDMKELDMMLQCAYEEVNNLKQKNDNIHESIKQQFFETVKKIEKDISQLQRERKSLRQKCQAKIIQAFAQLKQQKNKDEKVLAKQVKECLAYMRQKTGNILKELKNIRRQRTISKGKVFERIQTLRVKYVRILKEEESKRIQCDKVIYDLLESTCNGAQLAIRRSVY